MGSGSSKTRRGGEEGNVGSCGSSASTSSFSSNSRRKRRGLLGVACLGSSSSSRGRGGGGYDSDDDTVDDDQVSSHCDEASGIRIRQAGAQSDEVKFERYQTVFIDGHDDLPCVPSNDGEWPHATETNNMTRDDGSSSQSFSGRSVNNSSRFLSRFSFVPGSVSFRLGRAASVGSSRAYPSSPTSFAASGCEEDLHLHGSYPHGLNDSVNSSFGNGSIGACIGGPSVSLRRNPRTSTLSCSLRDNQVISTPEMVDNNSERTSSNSCLPSLGNSTGTEGLNRTVGARSSGVREPMDRNVRFSRTLSVGRLRDRVLQRSSFSDLNLSPLQVESITASDEIPAVSSPYPVPSMRNRFYASQNSDVETSHTGHARRHDLLEHRSNFTERRRRIRSQVRALQRLGSRFENLSGHERYCILSGQHRTGRCACRINARESNSNDDSGARASISRIVMLAEALFEVLDEIHQQSVVLSSRPSVSSIGSLPAPNEVVESLPTRSYTKSSKLQSEEVAQCYICLVEYEEGDDVRILPCHHEFHKMCIDKWLKDIHRVCPLCRGDICSSDS